MSNATLRITDGTTHVDLIQGAYRLLDWTPLVTQPKEGGRYIEGPLSDGRTLVDYQWGNVVENHILRVNAACQDSAIEFTQTLRRLLVQAMNYWTEDKVNTPVYIECRAPDETNTRYALIMSGSLESDDNYFEQPFTPLNGAGTVIMDDVPLTIERLHWMSYVPGTAICQKASDETTTRDHSWEEIDSTAAREWEINTLRQDPLTDDIYGIMTDTPPANWWVYRSQDDGDTWVLRFLMAGNVVINSIAVSPTTGYVFITTEDGGGANVRRSVNGAAAFASVDAPGAAYGSAFVFTLNNGYIIAVYQGSGATQSIVRMSINDGVAWNTVYTIPATTGAEATAGISTTGSGVLIALVDVGFLLSSDNGTTWSFITSPFSEDVYSLLETADETAVLCGMGATALGRIGISYDAGLTWEYTYGTTEGAVYTITEEEDIGFWAVDKAINALFSEDKISWVKTTAIHSNNFDPSVLGLASGAVISTSSDVVNGDAETWLLPTQVTVGVDDSCTDDVFVANKDSEFSPTHIHVVDQAAIPTQTDVSPPAALPYDLYPAAPAVTDWIAFGCTDGPFCSLVFDLSNIMEAASYTIIWEYSDGEVAGDATWATLIVQDNTQSFSQFGINTVHWRQPDDWVAAQISVVPWTAFWVRARISALVNWVDNPTQQDRDIYSVIHPSIYVDEDNVGGDLPLVLQVKAENVSDKDGAESTEPILYTNEMVIGRRQIDRGQQFTAYINCSDEQLPLGVSVAAGTATTAGADTTTPTGRKYTYNPTGLDDMADRVIFTFDTANCRDFYGNYHAYLRCREYDASNDIGNIAVRLRAETGSGGIESFTNTRYCQTVNDWQVLDFGRISIGTPSLLGYDNIGDEVQIAIQCSAESNDTDLYLYDLILIPTGEWAGAFTDTHNNENSMISNRQLLDVDNVTFPKRTRRALARTADALELVRASYQVNQNGLVSMQPKASQYLWFLANSFFVATGAHDGAGNLAYLSDANGDFLRRGVEIGKIVVNETDGSTAIITEVNSTEVHGTLSGGTDNDWDVADVYHIITDNKVSYPELVHKIDINSVQRYLAARGAN